MNEVEGRDGTKSSGFVKGGENKPPRQCGNCIWVNESGCGNELVILDPEVPKNKEGYAIVDSDDCCNSFQSQGNVLIYAVRHGETVTNKQNKFRGWIDVDLNDVGRNQAKEARKILSNKKIKQIFSSDLNRALETAGLVYPSIKPTKDADLRPWDVGVFSGKDRDLYQEALNRYIDNPDKSIPQGESLQDFAKRQAKVLKKYVKIAKENGPILLVFHSSNCIQLEKQIEGRDELGRPEAVDKVNPGGIMVVLDEGDAGMKVEIIHGGFPEKEGSYGS